MREELPYRAELDGLRAVAIILVVGYHAGLPGFGGGFVGVDIFFVISGFVITRLLWQERSAAGLISWPNFFARRVRRLAPAALVMFVVLLVPAWLLLSPWGERQAFAKSLLAALSSTSNLYFWKPAPVAYFSTDVPTPLLHTWSLSLEEQFYLALPIAVLTVTWLAGRLKRDLRLTLLWGAVAMTLGSLVLCMLITPGHQVAAFYAPVTRAFEFGLGVAVALSGVSLAGRSRWVAMLGGALLLGAPLVWVPSTASFPGVWALVPCLGAASLILAGSDAVLNQALGVRPLVEIGRVSYGWYLWHWPLLTFAVVWNVGPLSRSMSASVVLVALAIAFISYHGFEQRFRRLAVPHVVPRPWRSLISGAAAVGVVAALAMGLGLDAKWFGSEEASWSDERRMMVDQPSVPAVCLDQPEDLLPSGGRCELIPYVLGRPTVVLRGDSHAWQYIPALTTLAREHRGVNVVAWIREGCPPAEMTDDEVRAVEAALRARGPAGALEGWHECIEFNEAAAQDLDVLAAESPSLRILAAGRWPIYAGVTPLNLADRSVITMAGLDVINAETDFLRTGLGHLMGHVDALDGVAMIAGPIPELLRPAPACLTSRWRTFSCDVARERTDRYLAPIRALLEDLAQQHPGTQVTDPMPSLCDDAWCRARSDGVTNYLDDDHLSATRSRLLADEFAPLFAP